MKSKYKPSKTLKKFLWASLDVIIAGSISYFTQDVRFIGLVPFLVALRNYLEHRSD